MKILDLLLYFLLAASFVSCGKTAYIQNEDYLEKSFVRKPDEMLFSDKIKPFRKRVSQSAPLIIIDAGHGGKDNGTESLKGPKYYEKNLALATSQYVALYLNNLGFRTEMTRKADEFIELKDRAAFANIKKPALFVSVHYNSAPNRQAEGIEVYFYQAEGNKKRSQESKVLAKNVLDALIFETKAKSRGVKHGNFAVIRETAMPAIIVEGGFMTHEGEMSRIKEASYMKSVAKGIAQGIKVYLTEKAALAKKL